VQEIIMTDNDMWAYEKEARLNGYDAVAGIDEAGRGPLAGPVVAASVILPDAFSVSGVQDSKKISPKKRETLFDEIHQHAIAVGVGIVDPVDIDRINILQASLMAMAISVQNLKSEPDFLMIDGIFLISIDLPQKAIPKGDSLSVSIAAASIVAKVTRDRIMEKYAKEYPEFNFAQHKGYPTKAHKEAIRKHGVCPIHRRSFKGVKEFCQE
jgi:ribonuclease HII